MKNNICKEKQNAEPCQRNRGDNKNLDTLSEVKQNHTSTKNTALTLNSKGNGNVPITFLPKLHMWGGIDSGASCSLGDDEAIYGWEYIR